MTDRVTLEMGEARELVHTFHHMKREVGQQPARDWLNKAFIVTMRRFGGSEALLRVKDYMRDIQAKEMCL